jgi:hypothetical protein
MPSPLRSSAVGCGRCAAAKDAAHWRIHNNDFCDLLVPPGATADPDLELPANQAGAAVVLLDSVGIKLAHNRCA